MSKIMRACKADGVCRFKNWFCSGARLVLTTLVFATATQSHGMAEEGPEISVQTGHASQINALAFSADGRQVLTGSSDNTLRVWDAASGREIRSFIGHAAMIISVAISPDGRLALSGDWAGTMRLWELASGRLIRTFTFVGQKLRGYGIVVPPAPLYVAFSPDGRRALSAGNELVLWDLSSGERIHTFAKHDPGTNYGSVASSPDGRYAASALMQASDGLYQLKLWDLASGEAIRTFDGHSGAITSVVFSPDGRYLLSGSSDLTARLWDVASGKEIRKFTGQVKQIQSVAFSPDGRLAISTSYDGDVRLWNVADGSPGPSLESDGGSVLIKSVAFSPNGRLVAAGVSKTVKMWDLASGKLQRTLKGAAERISSVAFAPDTAQVLTGGHDGRLNFWNIATGREDRSLAGHANGIYSVAISRDGRYAVSGGKDETAKIWDFATGKEIRKLAGHRRGVSAVAFHPDGKQIITGSLDSTLRLWDVASGSNRSTFTGHRGPVQSLALSPDGSRAVSGDYVPEKIDPARSNGRDGNYFAGSTARQWDIATGAEIRLIADRHAITGVNAVAYSPDGRQALLAGHDAHEQNSAMGQYPFVRIIDVASGNPVRFLTGHKGQINALAFSPNGQQALSGSADNTLKLWDVGSGREIRTYSGHLGQVNSVAFSPDGRLVMSGSDDATTRIWDIATGKELLKMVHFLNDEWLAITPEGYFSASSARAAENLNVSKGLNIYSINQFYDVFYRPDIVEARLAGKDASGMIALTIDEALRNPPPLVEKVDAPDSGAAEKVKIAYRIKSEGGGIGEVRVFHNGKLVRSDGVVRQLPNSLMGRKASEVTNDVLVGQLRSLAGEAAKDDALKGASAAPRKPDMYDEAIEIEPVPGENEISVVAFNAQNSVQSQPQVTTFKSDRAPVAPRLHILAIGIDEYKDKSARLKFAAKDARDLAAQWKAQAANVYGAENIFVETISNAQASRQGILARINQLAAKVKPTDHFLLFVASHGVLLGDQYYMVTSDYDGALQPSKLISANEIVDFSKRIKALSQLYILDTCHAGGMGGIVSGLYDARVSVLAKKMGLHVYASASSAEEALDGFEGNGLFTHTLLSGLNNNRQADANGDKQVSLTELGMYSKVQTRDTAKRLSHRQDPLIINFGVDNPVYRLP